MPGAELLRVTAGGGGRAAVPGVGPDDTFAAPDSRSATLAGTGAAVGSVLAGVGPATAVVLRAKSGEPVTEGCRWTVPGDLTGTSFSAVTRNTVGVPGASAGLGSAGAGPIGVDGQMILPSHHHEKTRFLTIQYRQKKREKDSEDRMKVM
jgi:hypothetical protein